MKSSYYSELAMLEAGVHKHKHDENELKLL